MFNSLRSMTKRYSLAMTPIDEHDVIDERAKPVKKYSLTSHRKHSSESGKYRELGSQPLPTIVTEDADSSGHKTEDQGGRPRAGTWGSHSKPIKKSTTGSAPNSGKSTPLSQQMDQAGAASSSSSNSMKTSKKVTGTRSNSNSRSNSRSNSVERRRSDDTASPTRKNALFDAFRPRSKSDASKTRKPSIIANMKNAVQNSLHRGYSSHASSSNDVNVEKESHKSSKDHKESRDHGRWRTSTEGSRNPVSKVMDLLRHRSANAISSEEKRRAGRLFHYLMLSPKFFGNS
ncbi:hypothetical protein PV325_002979 [Microctonus aethiopoides]|nr:hypothetical protein PV325_002979 [Microctonus aethiopoides]